jgi:hypothetical protein
MILEYPEFVAWDKKIDSSDALNNFNARQKKYLASFIKSDNFSRIHHKIEFVNDTFLDLFIPFYTKSIEAKKNPYVVDIKKLIELNSAKHEIYCLSIFEDNEFVGGSIFIHRKERITTSVKSYLRKWSTFNNSVSPTLLAESYFYEHAIEHDYKQVSHGKDRNPYGLNSNINLCATKLQLGYVPQLPKKGDCKTISIENINEEVLVMLKPTSGNIITNAVLFSNDNNPEELYNYLLSNKSELDIKLVHLTNQTQMG